MTERTLPIASGMHIVGWAAAVPETRITNHDLEQRMDTSHDWIVERTGIHERRAAGPNETTATLAATAAIDAIKRANVDPTDIDLLIIATCTPEQPIPHTGAFVGEMLGLRCASFDINAACSGFVYSLIIGASMVASGMKNVLVVGSETLTRITDPFDRATSILFADGAGAAVLQASEAGTSLLGYDLGCDGSASEILGMRGGGSRFPPM